MRVFRLPSGSFISVERGKDPADFTLSFYKSNFQKDRELTVQLLSDLDEREAARLFALTDSLMEIPADAFLACVEKRDREREAFLHAKLKGDFSHKRRN